MLIGIIIVIIFLSVLILIHELGHFFAAKKFGLWVQEFGFGLPPRIWGKKKGETVYSVNALPFGGFVKIYGEDQEENDSQLSARGGSALGGAISDKTRSFSNLPAWKRAVILIAGVVMNFILGWVLISIVFAIGIPQAVFITDVKANSPAAESGILANDKILDFKTTKDFISFIDQNRGKEISLKIERAGKEIEIKSVPRKNPPAGEGALGIALIDAGQPKMNIFSALWGGLKSSFEVFSMIYVAIFKLIQAAILGKGSLAGLTGPVGIVKITGEVSKLGLLYLLQLLALISLNLAAINIFPFPALDGGRILFLIIEKIKGSPLPQKFERYANALGLALLLFLMLVITIKDIARF